MKYLKCLIILPVLILTFLSSAISVAAYTPYSNYTYSTAGYYEEFVYSPAPYTPKAYYTGLQLGTSLSNPVDFMYGPTEQLYIVDAALNKVVVLDQNFGFIRDIQYFNNGGQVDELKSPQGIFVDKNGHLYIADSDNQRIVHLNDKDELIAIVGCPDSPLLTSTIGVGDQAEVQDSCNEESGEGEKQKDTQVQGGNSYVFKPQKVVVDDAGILYIVNANEKNGLMKIAPDGTFISFVGSNKAIVNPIEKLWKQIMSKEQASQMISFVPVEYKNVSYDQEGFIYAVSAAGAEETPLKRLNLSGEDILIRNGYVDIVGDVLFDTIRVNGQDVEDRSILTDVVSDENGCYFALDSNKGRIFTYNREGYLLYVFGGKGTDVGTFENPAAIEVKGDALLVLDSTAASITVFEKTTYACSITEAENCYYSGQHDKSMAYWQEALKQNAFFEFGYLQMGKIYLQKGENEKAMRCFELGNYRGDKVTNMTGFNKAFVEFRKAWMAKNMGYVLGGGLGIILLLVIAVKMFKRCRRKVKREKGATL